MSDQVFGSGEGFSVADLIAEQKAAQAPEAKGQSNVEADPEESGQPAEKDPEAKPATQESEPAADGEKGDSKLLAGRYKTEAALFKGASEIADFLGEEVDFSEKSIQEIEEYYAGARKRMSKRGEIKDEKLDPSLMIVEKLNELIQLQSQKPAASTKQPESEPEAELTDDELDEMYYESPSKAMKILIERQFKTSQKPSKPVQSQPQQPGVPEVNWNQVVGRVANMVDTHGDGDFEALRPDIARLVEQNPDKYLSSGEHGIFQAYHDAKAIAESKGQMKQITANRQTSTAAIEKSKQAATIETGRSSRQPEPKLTKEEQIINRIFAEKPQKGIWG